MQICCVLGRCEYGNQNSANIDSDKRYNFNHLNYKVKTTYIYLFNISVNGIWIAFHIKLDFYYREIIAWI